MYPYTNYYDAINRQPHKMISDLEKAINGEYSAINRYAELAKLAANEKERQQILEIREDEVKHYQQFVQLYNRLTGRQHQPKTIEECPDNYKEGLELALQDEQHTVNFYLELADVATDPAIKEIFRRAASDEQNHAVWFLYFFSKRN